MTSAENRPVLLEARDIVVHYGRIKALHGVSLVVHEGEFVTLLGANGAGKTTMMRAISGLLRLTSGSVWFEGRDITRRQGPQAGDRAACPGARGPRRVPPHDGDREPGNGRYGAKFAPKAEHTSGWTGCWRLFPRLAERRTQLGGTLSGGEQQMLAIGRALMARPKVLLLDEPSMGLAPHGRSRRSSRSSRRSTQQGTTVLLVEQNAQQALTRSDRAYILETGEVTRTGNARELLADDSIRAAYLGVA